MVFCFQSHRPLTIRVLNHPMLLASIASMIVAIESRRVGSNVPVASGMICTNEHCGISKSDTRFRQIGRASWLPIRLSVQPRCVGCCWSLTRSVWHPALGPSRICTLTLLRKCCCLGPRAPSHATGDQLRGGRSRESVDCGKFGGMAWCICCNIVEWFLEWGCSCELNLEAVVDIFVPGGHLSIHLVRWNFLDCAYPYEHRTFLHTQHIILSLTSLKSRCIISAGSSFL